MTDDSKVDLACLGDDASKAKKVDVELAKTATAPPSPSPASSPPSAVVKKEAKAKQTKQSPTAAAAGPKSKGKSKSTVAASLKRTKSAPPAVLQRKRSRSGPKSKSSSFIGVSQYRRTGRWEAHIWDCAKSRSTPGAKGRQLHLGSFDCAEDAARAYDRAAIHFRGINADTNYPREQYTHDPVLNALKELDKEEFVIKLRGVAQHHKMQTQKKKEKLQPPTPRRPPPPPSSLKRTASYPLQSPHSVLQHPGGFATDEYVEGMHHVYTHHGYQEKYEAQLFPITHSIPRRRSNNDIVEHQRRLPYREQTLVYRGRVLSGHNDALDLHQCQSDLLSDPHIGVPNQMDLRAAYTRKQQEAKHNAKDMHLFLDETLMTFPAEDHFPTELQSPITMDGLRDNRVFRYDSKPNVSRPLQDHYIQTVVEDYHLFEETNNMIPDLRTLGNRSSQLYPERGPAPLMEGMGEVDTRQ